MIHQDILIFLQIILVALQIINIAGGKLRTKLINENTKITKGLKRELESGRLDQG
jgi:hypothetical protein